jgi:hypothetical protein
MNFSQRDFQTGQVVTKLNDLNQSDQQLEEQIESVSSELNTMLDSVISNLDNLSNVVDTKANAAAVTQALSTKADLINGVIPATQLPAFVDDVLNGKLINETTFQDENEDIYDPESGKIYIDVETNKTYRWSGIKYIVISDSLALGETESTAGRGDYTKAAHDHSLSHGNPHNATTSDIPEGNKLYFTEDRVLQAALIGLNTTNPAPVTATDALLAAIGKLQAQVSAQKFNWINASAIGGYIAASGVTTHSNTPLKFAIKDGLLWVSGAINITQANANAPFLRIENPNYRLKVALGGDVGYITVTHVAGGDFLTINQIPVRIVSNNTGGQQGIWLYAQANITPQSYGNTLIFQPSAIGQLLN